MENQEELINEIVLALDGLAPSYQRDLKRSGNSTATIGVSMAVERLYNIADLIGVDVEVRSRIKSSTARIYGQQS